MILRKPEHFLIVQAFSALPVTPIVDVNDIEIDLAKPEVLLPSVAYDAVFEALEISQELLSELEKQGLFYPFIAENPIR